MCDDECYMLIRWGIQYASSCLKCYKDVPAASFSDLRLMYLNAKVRNFLEYTAISVLILQLNSFLHIQTKHLTLK